MYYTLYQLSYVFRNSDRGMTADTVCNESWLIPNYVISDMLPLAAVIGVWLMSILQFPVKHAFVSYWISELCSSYLQQQQKNTLFWDSWSNYACNFYWLKCSCYLIWSMIIEDTWPIPSLCDICLYNNN